MSLDRLAKCIKESKEFFEKVEDKVLILLL
jgi:hypothetical protein